MSHSVLRFLSLALLLLVVAAVLLAAALARPPAAAAAPVVFVAADGDDANPGTPGLPVRSITRGLELALPGVTVSVGPGEYDAGHGEVFPIAMRDSVAIVGSGPRDTIVHGDASASVFSCKGIGGARLESLTVENGYAEFGGGVYALSSTCSFFDVWFEGNSTYDTGGSSRGGGLYLESCTATIDDCSFRGNTAGWGGATYCTFCEPTYTRCQMRDNTAPLGVGGAVAMYAAQPHFVDCGMVDNSAGQYGAVYFNYGSDGASMERCVVKDNTALAGNGGAFGGYESDFILRNCLVTGNRAIRVGSDPDQGLGGAVYLNNGADAEITNCTFAGNTAVSGRAVWSRWYNWARLTNDIFWDGGDELVGCIASGDNATVEYCDVQGGGGGTGCISGSPMFVDAAAGDYHLAQRSNCVDVGDNARATATDLDGVARPQDGDLSGGPGGAVADMGAYELLYAPTTIYVRESGDDATGSGTLASPFRSVTHALGVCLAGDTIDVGAGTFDAGHGESFPLELVGGVEVRGAGPEDTHIVGDDANGVCRASVEASGAALRGCSLENGRALNGGGLRVDGASVEVDDVHIDDCHAVDGGGGIYCGPGSDVRCRRVEIGGSASCDAEGRGGGLCVEGVVARCDFVDGYINDCHTAGPGGGAYYSYATGRLTGSRVKGCTTGISSDGGGLCVVDGSAVDVVDTEFDDCSIFSGRGGGIFCAGVGSHCDVTGGYLHDCWAGGGGGACYAGSATGTWARSRIVRCGATESGGGVRVDGATLSLGDCDITGSHTVQWGGGLYSINGSVTLNDCDVAGNVATATAGAIGTYSGELNLTGCRLTGNTAGGVGGVYFNYFTSGSVDRCLVADNTAMTGDAGAIAFYMSGPSLTNCVIARNTAAGEGGGLYINSAWPTVRSCTIVDNAAATVGGVRVSGGTVGLSNCILFNGGAELDGGTADYCDIEGGWVGGGGNIETDPRFVDRAAGDYHLKADAPCIDSGTNTGAPDNDCDLVKRPQDGDNSGVAVCDIGAYERPYMAVNHGTAWTASRDVEIDSFFDGAVDMRMRNEGDPWSALRGSYSGAVPWTLSTGDGPKTVSVEFTYTAPDGDHTIVLSDDIGFDSTPPEGSFVIDAGAEYTTTGAVWLDSSISDAVGIEARYRNEGGTWTGWEPYLGHLPWTLGGADGVYTVEAEFRDALGHVLPLEDSIALDTTPPEVTTVDSPTHPDPGAWYPDEAPRLLWPWSVGSVATVEGLGFTDRLTVGGHYAYVCSWGDGGAGLSPTLFIYDVFDPEKPLLMSATAMTDAVYDACAAGRFLYVVTGRHLRVYDVFDKTAPVLVGEAETKDEAKSVDVEGHTCAVATYGDLETFDVRDPADPVPLDAWAAPGGAYDVDVDLEGGMAYCCGDGRGFFVVDARDPADLRQRGALSIGLCRTLKAVGSRVYLSSVMSDPGLYVIDVSDPDAPGVLDTQSVANAHGIAVAHDFVFVSSHDESSITAFDVSSLPATEVAEIKVESTPVDTAYLAGHLYLGNRHGLEVVQVDLPTGYSFELDHNVVMTPDETGEGRPSEKRYADVDTGLWYFHVRARDAAGLWGPAAHRAVRIDTTPPVTTDDASGGWVNHAVTVTLSPTDAGSGSVQTQYKIDAGRWWRGTSVLVPAPTDGTNDGVRTIAYRSIDAVLNIEDTQTCEVRIDTQAPTARDNADGAWHRGYELRFDGDDVTSGVDHYEYSLDDGDWLRGDEVLLRTWRRGANSGVHAIDYRSVDAAGNASGTAHCSVLLDNVAPATTDDAPVGPQASDVTVTLTCGDALSGWAETRYSIDGGTWQSGTAVLVPAPSDGSNNGLHWISYYSTDNAGNNENWRFCPVLILTP